MIIRCKQSAFSLAEVLVSLSLLAVLASLMYPMLTNDIREDKLASLSKSGMWEILQAYGDFQEENIPAATTRAGDIADKMNYVRKIADGTQSIQVIPLAGANLVRPCNAFTPCLLLQSGGLLQYDADTDFAGTTFNTNALKFNLDPDADGPEAAVTFVLFINGRITTYPYKGSAAFSINDSMTPSEKDPYYTRGWTAG